uniref:NADH-ubiquinone oxidoreductase chain 4L n=1 Tax=Gymnopis multiplicata TaxID=449092 RepID=C9D8G7_GYMMU|nr:NADH dehydrogenase subunit 4L [Gymnopis multiplicata]ACS37100.1 NADH dehydrogenase subunit 4L [Gymnopis multiplicata]
MSSMNFMICSTFMISMTGLAMHRAHLLSALICLEGLMLSLFLGLTLWSLQMESMLLSTGPMTLLTLSACEASTGLAILVATTRTHGSDLMKNLNMLC